MNFIQFFNELAIIVDPNLRGRKLPTNEHESLCDTDVDSLNRVMISVYLCDFYGINEEVGKTMPLTTVATVQTFLEANKTKEPASFEEALGEVR